MKIYNILFSNIGELHFLTNSISFKANNNKLEKIAHHIESNSNSVKNGNFTDISESTKEKKFKFQACENYTFKVSNSVSGSYKLVKRI
jgi:hypothetical protein